LKTGLSSDEKAVKEAVRVLRGGGSVLDAVEEGVKVVEDDPSDQSVEGGLPNLLGEVELDASIMDGASLRAGAVAGVRRFSPIGSQDRCPLDASAFHQNYLPSGFGATASDISTPPYASSRKSYDQWVI